MAAKEPTEDRQTGERRRASAAAQPQLRATAASYVYAQPVFGNDLDIAAYADELKHQADKVVSGDVTAMETMLAHQANTLDMIFNRLALKAANSDHVNQMEAYLRHALRAQAQCRATLETLAEIKNPRPVAFVRQANIANGPQQVNNGIPQSPRTDEKNANQPNELLEATNGERVDTRATRSPGRGDPTLETVGEVHGTSHTGG
ncbi:Phasin domain-containing protein [Cupriavidus oxalaticus]|uniref:hypothetical protein n=1 Tax=Cupriavidus oxalaticus TaxID=96344 RepID=UPI003F731957